MGELVFVFSASRLLECRFCGILAMGDMFDRNSAMFGTSLLWPIWVGVVPSMLVHVAFGCWSGVMDMGKM